MTDKPRTSWCLIPPIIWEDTGLTLTKKCLLGRIHALEDSRGYCFASNSYLAEQLRLSISRVKALLKELSDAGYINREVIRDENNKVTERRLCLTPLVLSTIPPRTENNTTPRTENSPYRIENIEKNIDNGNNSLIGEKTQKVVDKYNALFDKQCRVTGGRKSKLKNRLETYTLDEILKAIEKASKDKFYSGKNDRGWKLTLKYLLRNDENIDTLLNLETKSTAPKNILT